MLMQLVNNTKLHNMVITLTSPALTFDYESRSNYCTFGISMHNPNSKMLFVHLHDCMSRMTTAKHIRYLVQYTFQ